MPTQNERDKQLISDLVAALQSVQTWLLDKGPIVNDGITHPLFVKANNTVIAALTKAGVQ